MLDRGCFWVAVVGAAAGLCFCVAAYADETSDAREGQALADKVCSPCHAVSDKAGRPFSTIAKDAYTSPQALKSYLGSTHATISHPGAMPNPELTDRQIEEIAAYLASLRAK